MFVENVCDFILLKLRSFFQRTVLCNSLVWSSEYTNRVGMTYQEALEVEQRCLHKLSTFPEALHYPVVLLAHRLNHTSVTQMGLAVYSFLCDYFMERELVAVECHDKR